MLKGLSPRGYVNQRTFGVLEKPGKSNVSGGMQNDIRLIDVANFKDEGKT